METNTERTSEACDFGAIESDMDLGAIEREVSVREKPAGKQSSQRAFSMTKYEI